MVILSEYFLLTFSFLFITTGLLLFVKYSYKKVKALEIDKLNYLFLELEKEKIISKKMKNVDFEIKKIKKETKEKLNQINISILNINFSFVETLKKH